MLTGLASSLQNQEPQVQTTSTYYIKINEIAWGGTVANKNDTWVELYNYGNTDVSLTGFTLFIGDQPIPLKKNIKARSYYLIEANEVATDVQSDLVSKYLDFPEKGARIKLVYLGQDIDVANKGGNPWLAGENIGAFCTMERINGYVNETWGTSQTLSAAKDELGNAICGTPKAANFTKSVIINEIGWMGTRGSIKKEDDEWIELFNTTTTPINMTGWSLSLIHI